MKIGCSVPKPTYPSLLWLAEWKAPAPFTCLQKIYVSCHSSSVLTSGNHGSQFLYRLQSNIALKMEKVPPFSYTDDCFTNQFCFWIFKRLKRASRYMTMSSMNSSPTTLETMTSSAMRSQREHRSFSEDWKVIKIQRNLMMNGVWSLIFIADHNNGNRQQIKPEKILSSPRPSRVQHKPCVLCHLCPPLHQRQCCHYLPVLQVYIQVEMSTILHSLWKSMQRRSCPKI